VTEADGPGIYPVSIRATDDFERSKSSTVSFSITVNELNSPPQLALPGNQIIDELTPLNVSASATDPDLPANTLTFTLVSGPPGLTLDSTSGAISWTPTEAQGPGNYRVTIQVTDNGTPPASDTRDFFITVNEANSAPSLVNPGTRTVDEHVTFSLTLQGSDSDVPVQSLTYSLLSGPPGMTLTGNQLAWTPDESFGGTTQTIQVRVTDNGSPNLSAIQTFDLVVNEVNNAPLILSPGNKTVDELVTLIVAAQAVDSDTPAQTLTFALASGPAGAVVDAATGQFSWTPAEADGPGTYTVRVKVTDNGSPARSATNTFTVTVNEVNIAPVLAQPAAQTVDEHQLLSLNLSATDSDLPANTLTYLLVSGPSGLTVNAAGLLRWTPGEAHGGGSFSVTVRVRDNGTPQLSDTQTFTVAVNEVNAAPALTRPADQTVNERESLSLQLAATDSDDPPQTLTYDLVSGPSGVSVSASGLLTWTPSESEGGSAYSIVVRVTDNGSPARSDSKLFLITVNDVNTAPTLTRPADQTVDEHVLLSLQLVGADDDLPAQALTYELVSGPAGMSVSSGGLLTWTPGEAEGGNSHTVTVRVRDDGSPALSATQSFSVTVSEVNAAPVLATIASQTMDECANLGLLMVATDADLPVQTLAFSLGEGAPAGATIDGSSGLFTFDQPSGAGVHTVSVIVTDNGTPSLSATQTFTITVNSRPTNVVDLAVGTALSATNTPCTQWKTYYRLTVPSGATRALFELTGLSGDVDLLLRRGAFPTDATFDYASATAGTASEQVVVVTNATLTDLGGEWFVAARNNSGGEAGFRVGTGLPTVVEGGTILLSPEAITLAATPVVFSGDSPQIQWTTVAGEKYQVEVSTDLSAWTVLSNVIVSGPNSTFTDPTPYADNQQRFYRIRQVPQ
jgi:large repetitive protein